MRTCLVLCVPVLLALASSVPAALAAGMELVPSEKNGLFDIRLDTAPLVTAEYVAWGAKWRFCGAKVTMGEDDGKARAFAVRFQKLDTDIRGRRQVETPNSVSWQFDLTFNSDKGEVIGGGIAFHQTLDSPARRGFAERPVLEPENRGWSWQVRPGQTIRIRFDPPVDRVYAERGNASQIRAMFIPSRLEPGKRRLTMTVTLPAGARVAPALSDLYGPADTRRWFKTALDPHKVPIDLSDLNHRPAGKHGSVRADGDRYVFADGTPVRFWGCNVQAYSLFIKDKKLIETHAARIAKLGYNLVRLHHHDSANWVRPCLIAPGSTSQELDEAALDSYFYWIHCLKEQGIYVWLDLHVGRPFREGDEIPGWSDLAKKKRRSGAEAKGFTYLNPRLRELMKLFATKLLTRKNPYTGPTLADEPAVMGVLLVNENELTNRFGNTFLPDHNNPYHQKLFEAKRDAFAKKHGLKQSEVGQTWVPGPAKLLLNDMEAEFNRDMIAHLRKLGLKAPIATCHQWGGNPLLSLPALTVGDVIDVHTYTGPEFLRSNPRHVPTLVHWIAAAQVVGKPLTITEYNSADRRHYNDAFTVPLYVSAMAAFQGWDAPMVYGYSQDGLRARGTSAWSSYNHPAIAGLSPAAAVLFRMGHVQPARQTHTLALDPKGLFQTATSPRTSAALRTVPEQHRLTIAMPPTPELSWLAPTPPTRDATVLRRADRDLIPADRTFVESDTGEIRRDWSVGLLTIDTPKSQAAVGWLGGRTVKLADATFTIKTPKAAVVLTSLDDKPLRRSGKILLTAVARVRAARQRGRSIYLSEPVAGAVTLCSEREGLTLRPLSSDGTPGPPIPFVRQNGVCTFVLPTDARTHWFLLSRPVARRITDDTKPACSDHHRVWRPAIRCRQAVRLDRGREAGHRQLRDQARQAETDHLFGRRVLLRVRHGRPSEEAAGGGPARDVRLQRAC